MGVDLSPFLKSFVFLWVLPLSVSWDLPLCLSVPGLLFLHPLNSSSSTWPFPHHQDLSGTCLPSSASWHSSRIFLMTGSTMFDYSALICDCAGSAAVGWVFFLCGFIFSSLALGLPSIVNFSSLGAKSFIFFHCFLISFEHTVMLLGRIWVVEACFQDDTAYPE